MTLTLIFLIAGASITAASSVTLRGGSSLGVRAASASALTAGAIVLLIGLVNTLSISSG